MQKIIYLILFILIACNQDGEYPKELQELRFSNAKLKTYLSFDQIAPTTPIIAALDFGLSDITSALFGNGNMTFKQVKETNYNDIEKDILNRFKIDKSFITNLKLLSYARQINSNHPYRYNPFFYVYAERDENFYFNIGGPAGIITDHFSNSSDIEGEMSIIHPIKGPQNHVVKYHKKSLKKSSSILWFGIKDYIKGNDKLSILDNILFHEFSHLFVEEQKKKETQQKALVQKSLYETGHDVMEVTNPVTAFEEGIAESFEAMFGTMSSQLNIFNKTERENFFGKYPETEKELVTLFFNRQHYIRSNSYLYNLYDFDECTLRAIGDDTIQDKGMLDIYDLYKNFNGRFYKTGEPVKPSVLDLNCKIDSSNRLESKEGFVASLMFDIFGHSSFLDSDEITMIKQKYKGKRIQQQEAGFLISFKKFIQTMKAAQPVNLNDYITYLITKSNLSLEIKRKIALRFLLTSCGQFSNVLNLGYTKKEMAFRSKDYELLLSTKPPKQILNLVASKLGKTPELFVTYLSQVFNLEKRSNINNFYAIDVAELFDDDRQDLIDAIMSRLNNGLYFKTKEELIDFLKPFGKDITDKAEKACDFAQNSIEEILTDFDLNKIEDL